MRDRDVVWGEVSRERPFWESVSLRWVIQGEFSSDSWYVVNDTAKAVSVVSIMIAPALRAQSSM